jgi:hypothetical protein
LTAPSDAEDLRTYLHRLSGCPPVQHTQQLRCPNHDGDAGVWFYVEADPVEAVARRRCLACGATTHLLDSAAHWTHPPMHACTGCGQSIVELAVGLHTDEPEEPGEPPRVRWLALAARCVDCGRITGLTDAHVPGLTVGEVAAVL